ncbi:50S ribosomal protein L11 [Candidatus Woesearchaeota archaeon]|nr:50S ribosomal protein L11 [Candidatus Woesearchaeota archaeon]
MPKETIEALIEGGKATAAPPLGPALGPLGVNIGQIISDINKKTQEFKGMEVPVTVVVDTDSKDYTISVGTPPTSQLLIKETGIKSGSGNPNTDFVADLKIEQVIKIAKMKEDTLLGKTMKEKVKEVMGTCRSMGIMIEGKKSQESLVDVNNGKYEEKIRKEKTELTEEELKELEEERKKLQEEIKERHEEFMKKGQKIIDELQGEEKAVVVSRLEVEGIPTDIIKELMPEEEPSAVGATPEEGKETEKKPAKEGKQE